MSTSRLHWHRYGRLALTLILAAAFPFAIIFPF